MKTFNEYKDFAEKEKCKVEINMTLGFKLIFGDTLADNVWLETYPLQKQIDIDNLKDLRNKLNALLYDLEVKKCLTKK
jgi:hypothetical protein